MGTVLDVELLRRDVHPAEVLLPNGEVLKAVRVFVTTRRLLAYRTSQLGEIEQALNVWLEQPCTVAASRATLGQGRLECRLEDGQTAWVNAGSGCGCGSPLRALAAPVPWVHR